MIDIGLSKMALIGAVALIVIGPEKLPRVARTVGTLLGKAQRYVADVKAEVNRSMELDELKKMKDTVESAARGVHDSIQPSASAFEKDWAEAIDSAAPLPSPTATVPAPEYKHPGKRWRLKRSALPHWYKARSGVRSKALSGAARVARYRPRKSPRHRFGRAARAYRPYRRPERPRASNMSETPSPEDELAGTEQPFVQHLVNLRDRLLKANAAVGIALVILFFFPGPGALYDFLAAPLVAHLHKGATLIATSVISPFVVPLKILLMTAFLLALPYVLWQVWAFVAPGLYAHEKRLVLPLVLSSTLLFFIGVAFCYYWVFGQLFAFIQSFSPQTITAAPDIEAYLNFVLSMFLAFGLAFEVPIALVVLVRMGVVSVQKLREFRGYFVVLLFIVAAIVTPPDVVSQLSLALSMCALYEVGLWAAQLFIKHTRAPDAPEETAS